MARKVPTWAIHTNIGRDPFEMAQALRVEEMNDRFLAHSNLADLAATATATGAPNQCPDIVELGSEADVNDEFSHDVGPNAQLSAAKQIREARDYGNLRPAQYIVENNVLVGPKTRNVFEQEAVAMGVFCWKCGDSQPDDKHVRLERHRILETIGYSRPNHLTVDDCCCTCGAELGLREKSIA